MTTLHIHQFEAHYRLPKSATHACKRLDAVLQSVLDEVLEGALERAGVGTHEEICIRHLYVPVRSSLSQTDRALALAWSLALADAIKRAVDGARIADVVRYGSRAHALIDLAIHVTLGDFQRAWAWRQLGLWRLGEEVSDREAAQELMHAWVSEPTLIIPVLRALAEIGVLQRMMRWLTVEQWMTLAHTALTLAPVSMPLDRHDVPTGPLPPALRQDGRRLAHASRLTEAFVEATGQLAEVTTVRYALAALVVLDVEPMALRAGSKSESTYLLLDAVAHAIWRPLAASRSEISASSREPHGQPEPGSPNAMLHTDVDAPTPARATARPLLDTDAGNTVEANAPNSGYEIWHPGSMPLDEPTAPLHASADLMPRLRRQAWTRCGGLLLLLNAVHDLGLPDDIAVHPDLTERSFRWCLHRLALTLIPMEPDDPAALAFSGLSPDNHPPSVDTAPATKREDAAICTYATGIQEHLRERLDFVESIPALMVFVCHRHAEIVADPGWLEVRLSLDSVSVEIRRSGLDLNPGYLPWLGVVVHFVYE
jgi:hypothetical protein